MLDTFFLLGDVAPAELLTGSYDQSLVALSVAMAILCSALAYYLADFANASRERLSRIVGIGTSGIVMGTGVWMMHSSACSRSSCVWRSSTTRASPPCRCCPRWAPPCWP